MIALVHSPLAWTLGWTLFHSLWEGAIVALVLAGSLAVLRTSRARYTMACLAMLAVLAYRRGDCGEAVSDFERSGSLIDSQAGALKEYGDCLARLKQNEKAIAVFARALAQEPADRWPMCGALMTALDEALEVARMV